MAQRLDKTMRREIANEVWRTFALMMNQASVTFNPEYITVVVNLREPLDLEDNLFISGLIEGYNQYIELKVR